MKDQAIYKEIEQILFNESPNIENEVHLVCKVLKHSVAQHVWLGDTGRVKENIFGFSRENALKVKTLSFSLKSFFVENGLGDWNVFYYKLLVKENCTRLMELHTLMRDTLITYRGSNDIIKTQEQNIYKTI